MNWETPPPDFAYVRFERIAPEQNAYRAYLLAWQPTLFGTGAVVRAYGRKGQPRRVQFTPFPTLEAAWPLVRALIKTRLRHGYRIVAPARYTQEKTA
jgi:predicted DNA-binding WGR domain protein